ncbi:MAG: hypothetical protein ACE5GI_04620 [Candidatus Aminicenantales bacterium]
MKTVFLKLFSLYLILALSAGYLFSQRRENIYRLSLELEKKASYLAQTSYDHFKGWTRTISDQEQAALFKSEAFAACCRLFIRLTEESSGYFQAGLIRTNLYSAYLYLVKAFHELREEMAKANIKPFALSECNQLLDRIDYEFSQWPSVDNLAYLHQKYVKGPKATVYMIERKGPGVYVRHPFKNLESIYRFNYDLKRGQNPWDYLVEVPSATLEKMEEGSMIDLNFEGCMVIEQSKRPNRPVYLIQTGKKRGLTSARLVERYGGWGKVYEIPAEIIDKYPLGKPIK